MSVVDDEDLRTKGQTNNESEDTFLDVEDQNCESSSSSTMPTNIACPKGLTISRFKLWQKNRPWLKATSDGKVVCSSCMEIKDLGLHGNKRLRIDKAFVDGTTISEIMPKAIKKFNDKISDHGKCSSHSICMDIISSREKNRLKIVFEKVKNCG